MKSAYSHPLPIKICLQDSIFRTKIQSQPFSKFNKKQDTRSSNPEPISSFVPQQQEFPQFIEYINAQYYGFAKENLPNGTGIMIDDEMNFFLSSWDRTNLNRLSLVKLLNETTTYGTWINNKMHGWNSFCLKHFQIYLQVKYRDHFGQQEPVFGQGLVIDNSNHIAYLLQINLQPKRYDDAKNHIKLQIMNRKDIPIAIRKEYHQNIQVLTQELFAENHLKIPLFLSSVESFMNHFSQNNHKVLFEEIYHQNEPHFFVSIQNFNTHNQVILKPQSFNPYRNIIQKESLNEYMNKKQKNLGLMLSQKSFKTKSIGVFDSRRQLNGIGLTVTHDHLKIFGHFKSNLLTKQLNQQETPKVHLQLFKTQKVKQKMKQHHMKSLNFVQQIIYLKEVNSAVQIANQIAEYVTTFQNEYRKRYGKTIDSFSASEQSFDNKYQIDELDMIEVKKQKNQLNQNIQRRPFGKIVNSRSPLRSIKKSHSKSPSDIETLRQRRPLEYVGRSPDISGKQARNVQDLMIHTNSAFNSRFDQETSKNRSSTDSRVDLSMSYKEILEAKIRQTQQQDIMETVRRRNEFSGRVSQERASGDRRRQDISRERIPQRRNQVNTGYKSRYDRLQRRQQAFWK